MNRPKYGNKETNKFAIELRPKKHWHHIYTKSEWDKNIKDQTCMQLIHSELSKFAEVVKDSNKEDLTDAFIQVCKAYDNAVEKLPVYEGFNTYGGSAFDLKKDKLNVRR